MFRHLLGVISITAMDLIFKELKRSNGLELTNENCGCILRTSCGLPCACELATHFSGQYIPIESIDVFWRKLDLLSYTTMQDDDLSCDAELEKLKLTFQKQSKFGKTNILKKIKGIYDATTSFVVEPAVQKNTRGRPNSKDKQKKIDPVKPTTFNPPTQEPPSCSSYVDPEPPMYDSYVNPEPPMYSPYVSEPPTYDSYVNPKPPRYSSYVPEPPRYSSYVDPEPPRFSSYVPEPPRYSSYVDPEPLTYDWYVDPEPPTYDSYVDPEPPRYDLYVDPEQTRYIDPLITKIPAIYQPYVRQIHNVMGDGNCGFRVVATCLGLDENAWPRIRRDLLNEIELHREGYANLFGSVVLNNIKCSIDHFKQGFAPDDRWMHMPDTGAIIASCYNVIVHFLSPKGSSTWLPLWSSPPENPQNVTWVIAHVNGNHYVKVDLQGNYPLPIIYQCWSRYKQDCAAMWEILYTLRI